MIRLETIGASEAAPQSQPSHAGPGKAEPRNAQTSHALSTPKRDEASYHRKLARVLNQMGNTFLLSDILRALDEGKMQSFVEGNSWAITEIITFPRARMLRIVAVVGDMSDIGALHDKILAFADQSNCGLISALGRKGWLAHGRARGWRVKAKNFLYYRDM